MHHHQSNEIESATELAINQALDVNSAPIARGTHARHKNNSKWQDSMAFRQYGAPPRITNAIMTSSISDLQLSPGMAIVGKFILKLCISDTSLNLSPRVPRTNHKSCVNLNAKHSPNANNGNNMKLTVFIKGSALVLCGVKNPRRAGTRWRQKCSGLMFSSVQHLTASTNGNFEILSEHLRWAPCIAMPPMAQHCR